MSSEAEWVSIESLTPWDRNPRRNDSAVDAVADSIRRFGWGSPIIVRRADSVIVAGHTRYKAAKKLGMDKVLVRYMDLDPAQAKALALADNKLNELAEWDNEMVGDILRELDGEGFDLKGLGWDDDALSSFLGDKILPSGGNDEPVEISEGTASSVEGEIYQLGEHRLICGDSTSLETWRRLLGEDRPDVVWTDPPYGVSYVGKTKDAMTIKNDELDNDGLSLFLSKVWSCLLETVKPGAPVYVAAPAGPRGIPFAVTLDKVGIFRQRLAWVKDVLVLGHSDYHYRHEDIYYGFVPGYTGRVGRGGVGWYGDNSQTTVLEFDKPKRNDIHPTMKPVELVEYCLENSSKHGDIVIEPFGGSGTTLIAAAKMGRVARLIELDPRYCDAIRKRWTNFAKSAGIDPGTGQLE